MVILSMYYLVNHIEKSDYLIRILICLKLLNHIANLLLAIMKLKGINNTLIIWLLVRDSIYRKLFNLYI